MQKWQVTFVDDHGVRAVEQFDFEQKPSTEDAAKMVRARLVPIAAKLDLNDLEGRTDEPTVKNLKNQNSIQILDITPVS